MPEWKLSKTAEILLLVTISGLPASARNVVTDWTAIASTTIVANGGKSPGASAVWFAYTNIAMYDAVNAITGEYRPFYYQGSGASGAAIDAAAAAAAHKVLVNYFPTQQSTLDSKYSASLNGIAADAQSKAAGVSVGEAAAAALIAARANDGLEANVPYSPAAAALIAARANDGLEANVPYSPGSGPGIWQPTPPAFAPAQTPWLAQMRPFTMATAADHRPPGPPAIDGEQFKRDYRLTHAVGGADSSMRSVSEREIGMFWTEHTAQQYARMFSNLVDSQKLSTKDTARLMAMLWTGIADAAIACWDGKFKYNFWRPVTAIAAGGGSVDTMPDSFWQTLAATPPHPEYPSGHGCVTGAATTVLAGFFGTTAISITADSLAFPDGTHTHTFADTRDLMDEIFWARMYTGFHYYRSMVDGQQLGTAVARGLLQNHFRSPRDEGIQ